MRLVVGGTPRRYLATALEARHQLGIARADGDRRREVVGKKTGSDIAFKAQSATEPKSYVCGLCRRRSLDLSTRRAEHACLVLACATGASAWSRLLAAADCPSSPPAHCAPHDLVRVWGRGHCNPFRRLAGAGAKPVFERCVVPVAGGPHLRQWGRPSKREGIFRRMARPAFARRWCHFAKLQRSRTDLPVSQLVRRLCARPHLDRRTAPILSTPAIVAIALRCRGSAAARPARAQCSAANAVAPACAVSCSS